jgi:hypothetical protein
VRIARSADGVIVNAWPAWGGRPVYVEDLVSETACTVCFSLLPTPKRVHHDHPDFQRLLETLMLAAAEQRDVFCYEKPGESNFLEDVCFADDACPAAPGTER